MLAVGTTDHPCGVTDNPTPSEAEIQFILKEIRNYLSPDVNGKYSQDRFLCLCLFYCLVVFLLVLPHIASELRELM